VGFLVADAQARFDAELSQKSRTAHDKMRSSTGNLIAARESDFRLA
jgi:hypothetical protein